MLPIEDNIILDNSELEKISPLSISASKVSVEKLSDIESNFSNMNESSIEKALDNLRQDKEFLQNFGINSSNLLSAITPLPLTLVGETDILSLGNSKTFNGVGGIEISSQNFESRDFHLEIPFHKSGVFTRIWILQSFYALLMWKNDEIRNFEDKIDELQLDIEEIEKLNKSRDNIGEVLEAKNKFFDSYIEFQRLKSDIESFLELEEMRERRKIR